MPTIRARVDIRAPWTPEIAACVEETLALTLCDGEALAFFVVWVESAEDLRVCVTFRERLAEGPLYASMLAQGVASCFPA